MSETSLNYKPGNLINFMSKRKIAMVFSILLIIVSLGGLIKQGLNLGIDFTGGTLVEVGYASPVELAEVRQAHIDLEGRKTTGSTVLLP